LHDHLSGGNNAMTSIIVYSQWMVPFTIGSNIWTITTRPNMQC